jgi:UDP-N-acetylmuramate--alanine ligase
VIHRFKDISVHFIGIGGIGMSGIAEVLLSHGLSVSGSDANSSATVEKLRSLGAKVYIGHKKENIENATVVVYSSAIKDENPEMVEARRLNRPIMKRAEMLAELMKLKLGIAVAGTHGKTTTTSILATILKEYGLDPTYIIGGVVKNLNGHASVGSGDYLVAEADESDGSFLLLNPILSVITNIDNDHLDHYGSEENLETAFIDFANSIPFYGTIALNCNDEKVRGILDRMKKPFVTFGINWSPENGSQFDYEASELEIMEGGISFRLSVQGENKGRCELGLPGHHNVLNALGAISLADRLGIEIEEIMAALPKFQGVGRRFQRVYDNKKLVVIDDYGHHPTEIVETIKTAKMIKGDKKLVVIFEPHRYSRTRDCWDQFLHCFNGADELILAPIYPASELEIAGITTDALVDDINRMHPGFAKMLSTITELKVTLQSLKDESAIVICMGAGTIGKTLHDSVESL